MSDVPYILHIWPPQWDLQSLDPACLAAVMYLQLSMPGKFQVAACSDPDVSPNGLLPFLTHGHLTIASLPAIVSFVASLSKTRTPGVTDIDASLSPSQKAQRTAWWSYIESNLGDLVSHIFYGVDSNFWGLTKPTLASIMPVPQRYYVPGRIRGAYRPRLESSGLWSFPAVEQEKKNLFSKDQRKQEDNKGTFARVFEREKVTEKARIIFGIHARLLEEKQFLYGDGMTSLDVYLAAHILLLANPPFPDSVLQVLLLENYPSLVDHARRIQAEVARAPAYEPAPPPKLSILSLFSPDRNMSKPEAKPTNPDIVRFRRMRWMWIAFALGAATYHIWNRIEIRRVPDDEQEDGGHDLTEDGGHDLTEEESKEESSET